MSSTDAPLSAPAAIPSLREALRRARAESAEKSGVLVELRTAEMARLDLLKEAIEPVLAQVPDDLDLFETALMPGDPARLFVDQLGFIEMGRDKRTYSFFQDTRYGRRLIAESEKLPIIAAAVTDYVARRLVEREQALASDISTPPEAARSAAAMAPAAPTPVVTPPRRQVRRGLLLLVMALVVFVAAFAIADFWNYAIHG